MLACYTAGPVNSPYSLATKNALRNKRRTVLTVLSITMSVFILGLLMSLYHAFYISHGADDQALRLITRHRVSLVNSLPGSYLAKMKGVAGVKEVMAEQWFGGVYIDQDHFFARFAVEPEKLFHMGAEMTCPDDQVKAWVSERTAALVGRPLMERYGWKIGDRVTIMGDIFPVDLTFTIRAVYDAPRNNENFFFHYQYLRESTTFERDRVGTYVILVDAPASVPRVCREIDSMFRNSEAETKTETERAFELQFLNYLGNVKMFLIGLCSAVTFMLLLVSGNTMAMSIRERVKEIGILKTLGFTQGRIVLIVLAEAITTAIVGAAGGLYLSHLMCKKIASGPMEFADLKLLHLPPSVMGMGLVIAIVIAVLGAIPAWAAARRSIVDCLRVVD